MTKDNFDDFICWDMIIDGDVLRKRIETMMKILQELENSIKEDTKAQAEEKVKNWLNETVNKKK